MQLLSLTASTASGLAVMSNYFFSTAAVMSEACGAVPYRFRVLWASAKRAPCVKKKWLTRLAG